MKRFVLLLWILCLSRLATAQPSPADAHYDRGRALYAEGRYAEAADAFDAANTAQPEARFVYNRAQAERQAGDCESAVKSYQAFLDTEPDEKLQTKAKQNLTFCEEELAKEKPPKAAPTPPPRAEPPPPPKPAPEPEPEQAPPFYADVPGGVLVGSGLLIGAVGGGLLGWSLSLESDASDAPSPTYGEHEDQIALAETSRVAGIVMLSAGAALLLSGIVRYGVMASREDAKRTGCSFAATGLRCAF